MNSRTKQRERNETEIANLERVPCYSVVRFLRLSNQIVSSAFLFLENKYINFSLKILDTYEDSKEYFNKFFTNFYDDYYEDFYENTLEFIKSVCSGSYFSMRRENVAKRKSSIVFGNQRRTSIISDDEVEARIEGALRTFDDFSPAFKGPPKTRILGP